MFLLLKLLSDSSSVFFQYDFFIFFSNAVSKFTSLAIFFRFIGFDSERKFTGLFCWFTLLFGEVSGVAFGVDEVDPFEVKEDELLVDKGGEIGGP